MNPTKPPKTRFAPSPTGHLHLGHVAHMLWTWGTAQAISAEVLIRVEDHDRTRCRPEFETSILQDLNWLGLTSPSTPVTWRQSDRHARYQSVVDKLVAAGLVYACTCSRKDIAHQTGQTSGELRYPGTCRTKNIPLETPGVSWRMTMPDETFTAIDALHGEIQQNPQRDFGDLLIRDRHQCWTYQLCVVVDDIDQQIDLVIRGDDLFSSIGRQLALRKLIDPAARAPVFLHHPLIKDSDGLKLSKRLLSEAIARKKEQGWDPAQVWGHAAFHAQLTASEVSLCADQLFQIIPADVTKRVKDLLYERSRIS